MRGDAAVSTAGARGRGVLVHIPPVLRSQTGGRGQVVLEAESVALLLECLDGTFPGIRDRIVDETGKPKPYVNLFVNDEQIRKPLAQVPLSPGDVVHILPSIAGG